MTLFLLIYLPLTGLFLLWFYCAKFKKVDEDECKEFRQYYNELIGKDKV